MQVYPEANQTARIAQTAPRYWEIDTARGLAVVGMVLFHFMWDLYYLGLSTISIFTPEWQFFARSIGSSFTFLLGISVAVRFASLPTSVVTWLRLMTRRGALIFGYGLLVSLVTYVVLGDQFVVFGILHMQGIALILAALAILLPPWQSTSIGVLMISTGFWMNTLSVPYPWLIWLGVTQQGRMMVDYYPLLPWAGFALVGVAIGQIVYRGKAAFALPAVNNMIPIRLLRWLGRHSLPIYLLHQPLLLGILMLWAQLSR